MSSDEEDAIVKVARIQSNAAVEDVLVPPLNFAMVASGVYRSGYPNRKNFPFLRKLGLRSILYLAMEDYSEDNEEFFKAEKIQVFVHKLQGNKEPFIEIPQADIAATLVKVLDRRNHPILVHCNKGKHRVGCLVGCLRKLQQWTLTAIFDEYQRFAGQTVRIADQQFIELFQVGMIQYDVEQKPSWMIQASSEESNSNT